MDFVIDRDENQYNSSNENPPFSSQIPIPEEPSPLTNESGSQSEKNYKRLRGGNFTTDEDLLIVFAWLNVSLDPIQGNEQKHKTFYTRVWEYFHRYKKFASDRTQVSLMNRWSTIQLATNKFCGCYAQIITRNQSGLNEQDKIADAKRLYKELNNVKFQLEHCWNELRYQPKWLDDCEKKKPVKNKTTSSSFVLTDSTPDSCVDIANKNISNPNFVDLERPPGRKAEKDRKKRKDKDPENDSSSACVSLLEAMREEKKKFNEKKIEMFERQYAQDQERLAYEKEKHQLEQMKEDERIMMTDTTRMPQRLADFYLQRQMEILAKKGH